MPILKKDQPEEMLHDLQMDYLHMNRRQYNLMEVFITGGDPREWHSACERALMRYHSIYQPYFQLLWQGRRLLGELQLKAHLETARQMKDTIATTTRIIVHLEARRQLETPIPVEPEHLVQLGSHVEDYLKQSVPFPDEKHKWEWLSSLGDTPQAKELTDQPLSELFLYEPFLFWYLPRHAGTLNQYLLQKYLGGYPSAL